jgi:hypothetical protein
MAVSYTSFGGGSNISRQAPRRLHPGTACTRLAPVRTVAMVSPLRRRRSERASFRRKGGVNTKAPSAVMAEGAFEWVEQLKVNELAAFPDARGHDGWWVSSAASSAHAPCGCLVPGSSALFWCSYVEHSFHLLDTTLAGVVAEIPRGRGRINGLTRNGRRAGV